MPSKRLASSGSCSRMSSDARKIDSSCVQERCTSSHTSSTERTVPSLPFHSVIVASKKPMKRLPAHAWRARTTQGSAAGLIAGEAHRARTNGHLQHTDEAAH
eukprot:3811873-Prymnesium_polylepis.1